MILNTLKQQTLLALILLSQCIGAEEPISGLIGGRLTGSTYTATVSPFNGVTQLALGTGNINSVALNNYGVGLVGGGQNNMLYGSFISSALGVQQISFPTTTPAFLNAVAINNGSLGLVSGSANNISYAAFVSQNTLTPTPLLNIPTNIRFESVALNDAGAGLIGGAHTFAGNAYVASVSSNSTTATEIPLNTATGSLIHGVAISSSGLGLIGGTNGSAPYAAFITSNNILIPIVINSTNGTIESVAVNSSATGLIGGSDFANNVGYAAYVFPGATPQLIPGLPIDTFIDSVAINNSGQGLIGGDNGTNMYAALVSTNGVTQTLIGLPSGNINSVAINDFNQGLIGGNSFTGTIPYAAIVSPSGTVTPLNLGVTGVINSVAINAFLLSQVPTQGLQGNNLIFSNYVNQNAPQNAFYLVPSVVDGSLSSALESAAPTRNMISYNTVMQNSFYLTTNLSAHLRTQRLSNTRAPRLHRNAMAFADLDESAEDQFLAGRCIQTPKRIDTSCPKKEREVIVTKKEVVQAAPVCTPKTASLWFEAIGALAYQDAQQQTTAFNPQTLGGTFGFDGKVASTFTIGGGGSYLYTHVHEKNHQGHSNIQQEDLFAYASWQPRNFYVDLGIWGGLYQTKQTRHIQLSGFDFKATSKPRGWQVVPHLELGFLATAYSSPDLEIGWNLLGMADWANAWQYSYTEKGDSPFNVHQDSHYGSLLRAEGGLRLSETLFCRKGNIIFQEKGSYVNIHSFKAGRMDAFLVGSPGAFTLQTLTNAQNLGLVQLSMTAAPHHAGLPSSMLMYQGEFGSGYQSHQLNVEFAWNF